MTKDLWIVYNPFISYVRFRSSRVRPNDSENIGRDRQLVGKPVESLSGDITRCVLSAPCSWSRWIEPIASLSQWSMKMACANFKTPALWELKVSEKSYVYISNEQKILQTFKDNDISKKSMYESS